MCLVNQFTSNQLENISNWPKIIKRQVIPDKFFWVKQMPSQRIYLQQTLFVSSFSYPLIPMAKKSQVEFKSKQWRKDFWGLLLTFFS